MAAAGLAMTACADRTALPAGSVLSLSSGDLRVPVRSMFERRYLTVVRQQRDFSCGSAALATLLRYHYGEAQSEQSVFIGMWRAGDRAQIRRLGFSLLDMKRYLAARGIRAEGYAVSLAEVERTRVPGIALIDMNGYKHFVVIKGMAAGRVLVGDPSLGLRLVDTKRFGTMWNGILFALEGATDRGRLSFGRNAEWGLAPRSRVTALMEPASLQSLELTRASPFPVEM